jgi:hypothetical protein
MFMSLTLRFHSVFLKRTVHMLLSQAVIAYTKPKIDTYVLTLTRTLTNTYGHHIKFRTFNTICFIASINILSSVLHSLRAYIARKVYAPVASISINRFITSLD